MLVRLALVFVLACLPGVSAAQTLHFFGGGFGGTPGAAAEERVGPRLPGGLRRAGLRLSDGGMSLGTEFVSTLGFRDGWAPCNALSGRCATDVAAFGSLRALVGVEQPVGLLYAHAGLAMADVTARADGFGGESDPSRLTGWTAGVGLTRPLGESGLSWSGDLSYYWFEGRQIGLGDGTSAEVSPEFFSARIGLGLSF